VNDIISATLNYSLKSGISKTRKRWNLLHTLKQTYVQTLKTGVGGDVTQSLGKKFMF